MKASGIIYALLAYGAWGVLPVYWKALASVAAPEVLAYRVLGTVAFCGALLLALGRLREVGDLLRVPRHAWALAASGLMIGGNWLIFIWAVTHDQLLEASFGYYLNPLISVLLGRFLLGESLSGRQALAVAIAALGVTLLGWSFGGLPWVSLSLSLLFAFYGLIHKITDARPIPGLTLETAVLAPLALIFLFTQAKTSDGAFLEASFGVRALLLGAGPLTALPLLWFVSAARRLPLSTLGLFQYIAPSISFVLAVLVYHEPFTSTHGMAFTCIWVALALYTSKAPGRSS